MKIYVSTDLEGVSGIVDFRQAGREGACGDYERARRLFTEEVNAVVDACIDAGVDEIVVMDGHGSGYNLLVEDLHPGAEYIVGTGRRGVYPGFDESFDGAILLGYHAMAGTLNGILDHTQSSTVWLNYYVNGRKMGEIAQSAIAFGLKGVPVILVTGDKAVCAEANEFLPGVETVSVKEGLSRTCAKIIPPTEAREFIKEGVKRAIERLKDFKPFNVDFPTEVKIEFQNTDAADAYERRGWKRVDGRSVASTVESADCNFGAFLF